MKSFRVLAARHVPEYGVVEVVKEITNDDNSTELNLHVINVQTLEWRAAEYGLTDVNEALEVILAEPFLPPMQPLQMSEAQARTQIRDHIKTMVRDARRNIPADRARLVSAGVPQVYVDAVAEEPLTVIRNFCPFTLETLAAKTAAVAAHRRSLGLSINEARKGPAGVVDQKPLTRKNTTVSGARVERSEERGGELPPIVLGGKKKR